MARVAESLQEPELRESGPKSGTGSPLFSFRNGARNVEKPPKLHKPSVSKHVMELGDDSDEPTKFWTVYFRVLNQAKRYWYMGVLSIVGILMFSVSVVLVADLMQMILDTIGGSVQPGQGIVSDWIIAIFGISAAQDSRLMQITIPLVLLFFVGLRSFGTVSSMYCLNFISVALAHDLRCMLYRKILHMPAFALEYRGIGFFTQTINGKVGAVSGAISKTLLILLREGSTLIGLLGYLIYINWKLSLLFFGVLPPMIYVVRLGARRLNEYVRRSQRSASGLAQKISDTMNGFREIQIFQGRSAEQAIYAMESDTARRLGLRVMLVRVITEPLLQVMLSLALAILVWMALDPQGFGRMTPGQFTSYLVAAGLVSAPARSLSGILGRLQAAVIAASDIYEMLDSKPEPDRGHYSVKRAKGRLEFRDVCFRYKKDGDYVLKNLNFVVEPGKMLALVGHTGSGKSTIMSLIMRFQEPQRGTILLDDMDIFEYQMDAYRRQLTAVFQHNFIFNATIYDNIAYGCMAHAPPEQVEAMADAAYVTTFSKKLPQGLDTVIGVQGQSLSGGERQRVAIARSLLKNAPILLLDEATSSLDGETEYQIQKATERLRKGRTTIAIAHRLTTVENADLILVLKEGEIVERGNHRDLIDKDGLYAALYQRKFVDDD